MLLLHTSDWHLGMQFRGMSLVEDQKFFIDRICDVIEREHVEGVLLAGDIFDRSVASQEALELYDYAMTRICLELKVPVMTVAGNHDGAERLSSCSEILQAGGLYIAGRLTHECMRVSFDDTEVFLLPWLTTEKARFVFPEGSESIESLGSAFDFVCDRIRASMTDGKRHILVAHAFVTGASTSESDRAAEVGTAVAVGAEAFEGFDYVALGHLHGPQNIGDSIRYCGTPMIYSFGKEEEQTKSVTLIDTADMSRRIVPLEALRAHTTLTGTYDELYAASYEKRIVEGFVKLKLTDTYAGGGIMSVMRERYPRLIEITGVGLDNEQAGSSMTVEELEREEHDPEKIFNRYLCENLGTEPDEHLSELFKRALERIDV